MEISSLEDIRQSVADQVNAAFEDLLRDTVRIISFQTVSGGNEEEERKYRVQIPACMEWLRKLAEDNGFHFHNFDNECAEIEWRCEPEPGEGRRPVFGIASHIDVVTPVGRWKHGPFSGHIEDGILYGRGIQDDKGPLIQALYGMIAVKRAGIRPPCDVRMIIGTREETGDWSDIAMYVKKRGAPDFGYTPDADFPLITGEKGMMNLHFAADWDQVEADTETGLQFLSLTGGERTNIVPGLAEVRLRFPAAAKTEVMKELVRETTRFTVENPGSNITLLPESDEVESRGLHESMISFVGKQAHSSTPWSGYNAIKDSLKFLADIETLPAPVRAFIQFLAFVSAEDDGTNMGIASNHDFIGPTTSIISLIRIGEKGGFGNMNIRPTHGMPVAKVFERAEEVARAFSERTGFPVRVEPNGNTRDASYLDPSLPGVGDFLQSLRTAYELTVGEPCKELAIGGTTYAKALPNCCAFGPVLPGVDEGLAHQADERLAVSSIKRNALIYGLSIALMGR